MDCFCGGGGSAEGVRRAGGSSHGIDLEDQPAFRRRFGSDAFTLGDALVLSKVSELRDRVRAIGVIGGQRCRFTVHTLASGQRRTDVVNTWAKTGVQTPWTPAHKEVFKQCSNSVS